jgi:hypothetical protein
MYKHKDKEKTRQQQLRQHEHHNQLRPDYWRCISGSMVFYGIVVNLKIWRLKKID